MCSCLTVSDWLFTSPLPDWTDYCKLGCHWRESNSWNQGVSIMQFVDLKIKIHKKN